MYLSRILLDIQNQKTMLALASPNLFHGAIESSVPGERNRKLWRIDSLNGNLYLLILCSETADWSNVQKQFGDPKYAVETKDYTPLLERITNGSRWRFRLCANPTVAKKRTETTERGKVLAHVTTAHQMQWLSDRAEKYGFSLAPDAYTVTESKWYTFRKNNKQNRPPRKRTCAECRKILPFGKADDESVLTHGEGDNAAECQKIAAGGVREFPRRSNIRLLAVTYEGILTVTNAELFRNALVSGIGREKAYGMGMLTVTAAGAAL